MATSWSTGPPLSPALSPHDGDFFLSDIYPSSLPPSPYAAGTVFTPASASSFVPPPSQKVEAIDPGFAQLYDDGASNEDVNSRLRKMSQSSNEREMSTDIKAARKDSTTDPEPESRGVKRKFSSDIIDYPRRRATIAVRV
jgi:hypothetical protein